MTAPVVADQNLRFTRFGQFWNDIHQSSRRPFGPGSRARALALEQRRQGVRTSRFFAVMGILGILLMILFRPRKPLIGYSRD